MIPNFFSKQKIPKDLPKGMQDIIKKLKNTKSKEQCLKLAYKELSKNHNGAVFGAWRYMPRIFIRDINKLWEKKILVCTSLAFLLRILLIKSKKFEETDLKYKKTWSAYVFPHVILDVKIKNKWIHVDVWGKANGIKFGEYMTARRWISSIKSI